MLKIRVIVDLNTEVNFSLVETQINADYYRLKLKICGNLR
jgi:hypothetical protein